MVFDERREWYSIPWRIRVRLTLTGWRPSTLRLHGWRWLCLWKW